MITFAQALEAANVLGYGMKMPLLTLSRSLIFNLKPFHKCEILSKFDFGMIITTRGIPSFQIAGDKGKTLPIFGRIGMG